MELSIKIRSCINNPMAIMVIFKYLLQSDLSNCKLHNWKIRQLQVILLVPNWD